MRVEVHVGDCVEVMGGMESGSVTEVCCDPPYGLEFMGKEWDRLSMLGVGSRPSSGGGLFATEGSKSRGYAGNHHRGDFQGTAFQMQLWHENWLGEVYRLLPFGGVVKAFSGTRTYHRLAAAMENVGFVEIGLVAWAYGSGFPKSMNVSKAIDKAAGVEREVIGRVAGMGKQNPEWNGTAQGRAENSFRPEYDQTTPGSPEASAWEGWGTALKPAWEPFLVGRKRQSGT